MKPNREYYSQNYSTICHNSSVTDKNALNRGSICLFNPDCVQNRLNPSDTPPTSTKLRLACARRQFAIFLVM